jgi:ABC-type nickel/cobalt efflux system permease component RcnA
MEHGLVWMLTAAASLGLVHTLLGPDHYLPFIALSRARGWGLTRTLRLTVLCGLGHVTASILLGLLGVAAGLAIGRLELLQAMRGDLAAWLLVGSGLAYAAWGLRRALRGRPHEHWHEHGDGSVHRHEHTHFGEHAHPHKLASGRLAAGRWAGWSLFTVFVLGPCEPLVPMLMAPAVTGLWWAAALIVLVFAVATLAAMVGLVTAGCLGLARLSLAPVERFGHTLAGLVIAACGVAVWLGL